MEFDKDKADAGQRAMFIELVNALVEKGIFTNEEIQLLLSRARQRAEKELESGITQS